MFKQIPNDLLGIIEILKEKNLLFILFKFSQIIFYFLFFITLVNIILYKLGIFDFFTISKSNLYILITFINDYLYDNFF